MQRPILGSRHGRDQVPQMAAALIPRLTPSRRWPRLAVFDGGTCLEEAHTTEHVGRRDRAARWSPQGEVVPPAPDRPDWLAPIKYAPFEQVRVEQVQAARRRYLPLPTLPRPHGRRDIGVLLPILSPLYSTSPITRPSIPKRTMRWRRSLSWYRTLVGGAHFRRWSQPCAEAASGVETRTPEFSKVSPRASPTSPFLDGPLTLYSEVAIESLPEGAGQGPRRVTCLRSRQGRKRGPLII